MIREAIDKAMAEQGITIGELADHCKLKRERLKCFLWGTKVLLKLDEIERVLLYLQLNIE